MRLAFDDLLVIPITLAHSITKRSYSRFIFQIYLSEIIAFPCDMYFTCLYYRSRLLKLIKDLRLRGSNDFTPIMTLVKPLKDIYDYK